MVEYKNDNFQIDVRRIRSQRTCWKCAKTIPSGNIYVSYRLLEKNYANGFWNEGCEDCFKAWVKDVSKLMIDIATSINVSNGSTVEIVNDMFDINGGLNGIQAKPKKEQRFNDKDRVRTLLGLLAGNEQ